MISRTAESDIHEMWEAGLKPTVADIIRLNAVALRMERCAKPDAGVFHLRRVAFLDGLTFTQPTVGHEIWRTKVERLVDFADFETSLCADAFICATPLDRLPSDTDRAAVKAALEAFLPKLEPFTADQVAAAILYAQHGTDWMDGEDAPTSPSRETGASLPPFDESFSFPLGVVLGGMAYGIGLTLAEAMRLSRSQLMAVIDRKLHFEGAVNTKRLKSDAEDDYLRTLDEITGRLKGEI